MSCHAIWYEYCTCHISKLLNNVVCGMKNYVVYIDDVLVFKNTWDSHMQELRSLLSRISEARLEADQMKCECVCAQVQYLGYIVDSKVEALKNFKSH